MSIRLVFAWLLLVVFVAIGLMNLNGAIGAAWVAGGPPNGHKEAWEQRSLVLLASSLIAFVLAVASFWSVKNNRFKTYFNGVAIVVLIGLMSVPYVREFLLQDRCLDSGGSWIPIELKCVNN